MRVQPRQTRVANEYSLSKNRDTNRNHFSRMNNPITQIQRMIVGMAALVGEGSIHAPEFHRKQLARKCEKILVTFKIRKLKWPGWIVKELTTGSAIGKREGYDKNNRHPMFD